MEREIKDKKLKQKMQNTKVEAACEHQGSFRRTYNTVNGL